MRHFLFLLLFMACQVMAETAAFDPNTGILTVSSVQIDNTIFSTTQVALPADGKWSVVGVGSQAAGSTTDTAVFVPTSNLLTIPSVRVGARLFSTTQVALPMDGKWAVLGIGEERAAPASNLTVTPESITGKTGEIIKINVFGGTPPYRVYSSDYSVASIGTRYNSSETYYSTSPAGSPPQADVTVIIGVVGTLQIRVIDANGGVKVVSVTSTGANTALGTTSSGTACVKVLNDYNYYSYYYSGYVYSYTPFSMSPATITAKISEQLTLALGGGTPPYSVISSRNGIASVGPIVAGTNPCQASVVVSALATGTVQLIAVDSLGERVSTNITVSIDDVQISPFTVSPTTVTAGVGEAIRVNIVGGKPPYHLSSSRDFVAGPDSGTYSPVTTPGNVPQAEAVIQTHNPGTATITLSDESGKQATVTVTVNNDVQISSPFSVSPTTASVRAGAPIKINISGGRPPYHLSSSYDFVAKPESGMYNPATTPGRVPQVEATIQTRSPGTATIAVSDESGKQASVSVTVNN